MSVISLETCDAITDGEYVWIFSPTGAVEVPVSEWQQMLEWWITEMEG